MRKKLFLIATGIGGLLLLLIILLLRSVPQPSSSGLHPDDNSAYKKSFEEIQKQEQPYFDQQQKVAQLTLKLPYKGSNFTLDFSYKTNVFTLTLKKGFENQGNQEFDDYLKSNGIPNRELLDGLQVK